MPENAAIFHPPTSEQIEAHLDAHPPRPPSPWSVWGPLAAVALATLGGFAIGGAAALILPWTAVIGLFVYLSVRVRTARKLEAGVTRIHEQIMLRRYADGLRGAWLLLPRADNQPLLHARTVALMADGLAGLRQHDAAITGYAYLLRHLPEGHPGAAHFRVQKAVAALEADRLADADDELRRLRRSEVAAAVPAIAAGRRFAELLQQVRTHHFDDAVADAGGVLDALRPLGVEAGYGHALLALSYTKAREGEPDQLRRHAATWWRRATTLLPETAILARFPQLALVAETFGDPDG